MVCVTRARATSIGGRSSIGTPECRDGDVPRVVAMRAALTNLAGDGVADVLPRAVFPA